jgi:hypothetical protein
MSTNTYQPLILKYSSELTKLGMVMTMDDDFTLVFSDDRVEISFITDEEANDLSVSVVYLQVPPNDFGDYTLDVIMELHKDQAPDFSNSTPVEQENLVKNYIHFIAENRSVLFGAKFPLAKAYLMYQIFSDELLEAAMEEAMEAGIDFEPGPNFFDEVLMKAKKFKK